MRRGPRQGGDADLQRINPDRIGDVLESDQAEIAHGEIEPRLHLPVGVFGKADGAGLGDTLQSRGDIDAVAHQIAVALRDDVAEMDADPKFDALVGRDLSVALDHRPLDFDGAVNSVDHAAELDDRAVAGALDDAAVMGGYRRVDEIAAQAAKTRERAILVGAGEPAESDDVGRQDRRDLAILHRAPLCGAQPRARCTRLESPRRNPLAPLAGRGLG